MPYQLASPKQLPDTDTSGDADLYELYMIPGDILVVGTDGLFDNMWDEELCNAVEKFANGRRRPRRCETP